MKEEGGLCHFLQFPGGFFFSLRGKTGLFRGAFFCIMMKITKGRGYYAEHGEKHGGGFLPFRFWRFPFLTGPGAGIFLHQIQRNK